MSLRYCGQTNWRPISLLSADYKILTKALANRLRKVLPLVIHPNQTCAVPGRSIEDNCALLRDISDYAAAKNINCTFLSLDQEKAFDSVDWEFMDQVRASINFGPFFRSTIQCLYQDIQSAIMCNGYITDPFDLHRGVRQGCPLSPLISGLHLPGGPEEKLTQYADDTTAIVTDLYSVHKVVEVFQEYSAASGARLNTSKCKGLWLGRWKNRLDKPCGFEWPATLKILGLYHGSSDTTTENWNEVLTKFTKTLNLWRPRNLTLRGKSLIINTLAAAKIWYVAKIIPPTPDIIKKLEKAKWSFLWSNKTELVRREVCCSGTDRGGLDSVDIEYKCKALLMNWTTRILTDRPSSWTCLPRYYIGRALGLRNNLSTNAETRTPFYDHTLQIYKTFKQLNVNQPSSKAYYTAAINEFVRPTRPSSELAWEASFRLTTRN